MRFLSLLIAILFYFNASAQRYGSMHANRYSYVHVDTGIPYVSVKGGYEVQKNIHVEVQAHTDGGSIWRVNSHNDWRSLSLLRAVRIAPLQTELRCGMGILQSEERIIQQKSNTFGVAPQLAIVSNVHKNIAVGGSITWPISPALNLTPAIGMGIEYRMGRYVKENGLY
jgi:hypothetical protein